MDETQVAPPVTPEPTQPVAAAPPPEQGAPTQADEQKLATVDPRFFAAYTQGQQKLAAVATALGISKTSSAEQFTAAITARRQVAEAEEEELNRDPRIAARMAAIRAREEQMAQAQYGESAVIAATLLEQGRNASLIDLASLVDQAVIAAAASRFGGAAPAQAGGTQPQPQATQQQPAPQGQAPERQLIGDVPRGNDGMFDPGIAPDRDRGPSGYFADVFKKLRI